MIGDGRTMDIADRLAAVVCDLAASQRRLTVAMDGPDAAREDDASRA